MFKRIIALAGALTASLILAATPVLAYSYYGTLNVANSGGAYTQLGIIASVDNVALKNNYYISTTGLDTRVTLNGSAVPHMITDDKVLFVNDIAATSNYSFKYEMGDAPLTQFYIIVGHNGYITTVDNLVIEPASNFTVEVVGYFDTTNGANKNIVLKDGAIKFYISGNHVVTGTVTTNTGDHSVTHALNPGAYDLSLIFDGTSLTISEATLGILDTIAFGACSVANTINDFIWLGGNVCPYVNSITYSNAGASPRIFYYQNTMVIGTALPEFTNGIYNGVITWGSNPAGVTLTNGALVSGNIITAVPTYVQPTGAPVVPPGVGSLNAPSRLTTSVIYPLFTAINTAAAGGMPPEVQAVGVAVLITLGFVIFAMRIPNVHLLLVAGAGGLGLALSYALALYSNMWIPSIYGVAVVAMLIMERKPAL